MIPSISREQQHVIDCLSNGKNVKIDAVAGSGKTTCNLHMARHFADKNILLLTYNAKLKLETRVKVKKLGIKNLEVHSYHSFCVQYYDPECYEDSAITNLLNRCSEPIRLFDYDIIVLDEAQDITPTFYELICKLYRDNRKIVECDFDEGCYYSDEFNTDDEQEQPTENAIEKMQTLICVMGDRRQSIYEFINADERYIVFASQLFNFNNCEWETCELTISYRITKYMANFINNCMLGKKKIIAHKKSKFKPRYVMGSDNEQYKEVIHYLDMGYKPSDIFIIAPSVKGRSESDVKNQSLIVKLENKIKKERPDIMVYVPSNDDEKMTQELMDGKLVFSTYNQTKGLERKVVIVMNFDSSYFEFYNRKARKNVCPNILYVATTRAKEHLSLIHYYTNNFLPFIKCKWIMKTTVFDPYDFHDRTGSRKKEKDDNYNATKHRSATELTSHLPHEIVDKCFGMLNVIKLAEACEPINVEYTTKNENMTEGVSELTGIAVPIKFEAMYFGKTTFLDELRRFRSSGVYTFAQLCLREQTQLDTVECETIEDILYIANCWNTYRNGYVFKVLQISDYSWLSKCEIDKCMERMSSLKISPHANFESLLRYDRVIGSADCIDETTIYEFKCVSKLKKEHYIQLALYAYMYEASCRKKLRYILFNIFTGECVEIRCECFGEIVDILFDAKYGDKSKLNDDEFIEANLKNKFFPV